jgi:CMP-N,N'-diacetyllegionaminic acid synthase
MMGDQRIIGVIPARGGSKGVPRKNLRPLAGRPLIAWSIAEALKSSLIDRLVVTTEDDEIAQVARDWGADVPVRRPDEFATDTARVEDAVAHLLCSLDSDTYDVLVMMHSTVPLRLAADIDSCIRLMNERAAPACISICEAGKPPFWTFALKDGNRIDPLLGWDGFRRRRQDLPAVFLPTGAVFVARIPWFLEHVSFYSPDTVGCVVPRERSVDIDEELDFALCETLFALRGGE